MQSSALSYAICRKMLLTGIESGTLGQNREKYYFITSGSLGMVNNPATNTVFGAGVWFLRLNIQKWNWVWIFLSQVIDLESLLCLVARFGCLHRENVYIGFVCTCNGSPCFLERLWTLRLIGWFTNILLVFAACFLWILIAVPHMLLNWLWFYMVAWAFLACQRPCHQHWY